MDLIIDDIEDDLIMDQDYRCQPRYEYVVKCSYCIKTNLTQNPQTWACSDCLNKEKARKAYDRAMRSLN